MREDLSEEPAEGAEEGLLTMDEAARFLDTSKSTLYRLISQQDIKGVKVGKQWRFRKADLVAYIERSPVAVAFDASARADLDAELAFFRREYSAIAVTRGPAAGLSSESNLVSLTDLILFLALEREASDIHFEPTSGYLRLRFRIDGVLHDIRRIPLSLHESLVARLKEISDMNLLERRLPQDGRAILQHDGKEFDLRFGLVPAIFGETVVIRILDRTQSLFGIDSLGADLQELEAVRRVLNRLSGLLIVTGPTGSGKTTLLYSCLQEIAGQDKKIITAEDPVEFQIEGATQIQLNHRAGVTFAAAMRSAMRQDPDVIMCGEIRDREVMELTVRGALTGHLVLSALHTESAPAAVLRMVGIGVEPYLVSASLKCAVAIRLARRLCPHCRQISESSDADVQTTKMKDLAASGGYRMPKDVVLYSPVGCNQCHDSGYRGRLGLFEILPCSSKLISEMIRCDSEEVATELAVQAGMRTLFADGMRKAVAGETSVEEVLRATGTWL